MITNPIRVGALEFLEETNDSALVLIVTQNASPELRFTRKKFSSWILGE